MCILPCVVCVVIVLFIFSKDWVMFLLNLEIKYRDTFPVFSFHYHHPSFTQWANEPVYENSFKKCYVQSEGPNDRPSPSLHSEVTEVNWKPAVNTIFECHCCLHSIRVASGFRSFFVAIITEVSPTFDQVSQNLEKSKAYLKDIMCQFIIFMRIQEYRYHCRKKDFFSLFSL